MFSPTCGPVHTTCLSPFVFRTHLSLQPTLATYGQRHHVVLGSTLTRYRSLLCYRIVMTLTTLSHHENV